MTSWQRAVLAVSAIGLCLAASQFAVRGRHEPTGNVGFLGTESSGVEGETNSANGQGVLGTYRPNGNYGYLGSATNGVQGVSFASAGSGVFGITTSGNGVRGSATNGLGVLGSAESGTGVSGSSTSGIGVAGNSITNSGMSGSSSSSYGVKGSSSTGTGIRADSQNGTAFEARGPIGVDSASTSDSGIAVAGAARPNGVGVFGSVLSGGAGFAGQFNGNVQINGTLTKSAGSFRIDHPLDPANKYLYHSFVESPDMMNIYSGNVVLDAKGEGVVELPGWFEALNRDFRYQLTCIGEHAPVYIASKVHDNKFRIAGGYAGMEVSWQVVGTRQDRYAEAHRIPVEEMKGPKETGRFLNPELYGQPAALGLGGRR